MLIELWERIRGYDKWVNAAAKIEQSTVDEEQLANRAESDKYVFIAGDVLSWSDAQGQKHYADFKADEGSPLYQLIGGESVDIRYNPSNPDEFYYRDLLRSRVSFFFRTALTTGVVLAFGFAILIFRAHLLFKRITH